MPGILCPEFWHPGLSITYSMSSLMMPKEELKATILVSVENNDFVCIYFPKLWALILFVIVKIKLVHFFPTPH